MSARNSTSFLGFIQREAGMKNGIYFAAGFCILAGLCIVPVLLWGCVQKCQLTKNEEIRYIVAQRSRVNKTVAKCYQLVPQTINNTDTLASVDSYGVRKQKEFL